MDRWFKNCKSNRKRNAKCCQECPFRNLIGKDLQEMQKIYNLIQDFRLENLTRV